MKRLAIIGAGPSGLAAAFALKNQNIVVEIFEKSASFCGRAASRYCHGTWLDTGANYLKSGSTEIEELLLKRLPTEDLARIEGDIWTFDGEGNLNPGNPAQNREAKWTYRSGISTLGKLLAARARAEIHLGTRVVALEKPGKSWLLVDADNNKRGPFDSILLTTPGPQTIDILEASPVAESLLEPIVEALRPTAYFRQFCFGFGLAGEFQRPGDFHALLNLDRKHVISWLGFENDKPGHVPPGWTVIVVQMNPQWSADHFGRDTADLAEAAWGHATKLLRWPDSEPDWFEAKRWMYAHPSSGADVAAARSGEDEGIYIAGDALVGKGRLNLALESGLRVAERIIAGI